MLLNSETCFKHWHAIAQEAKTDRLTGTSEQNCLRKHAKRRFYTSALKLLRYPFRQRVSQQQAQENRRG